MADLLFMKLSGDGFKGEEPIGSSKDLVRIKTFSHDIAQDLVPIRPSAVGSTKEIVRGTPRQGQFTVTRHFDKISPKLFSAATAGIRFDAVSIYFCSVMADSKHEKHEPELILQILLENAVIANFQYGYNSDWPTEIVSFAYTSIGWKTNWPDPTDGTVKPLGDVGWNGELNKPAAPDFNILKWEKWGS
jgi:type VI secretion system secreted protein Hcp